MMIETVLNFNGSATPNKGPDWFDRPFWSMERLPGQLMGLGCDDGGAVCGMGAACPTVPSSPPSAAILSSPSCSPTDSGCVVLSGQIQQYNNALKIKATADWNRLICESNKCLNQDNTDCNSRFPAVPVPPRPNAPGQVDLQWDNGFVTGYARPADPPPVTGGSGGGTGTGKLTDAQEQAAAKKSLTDAMDSLGVGGNQSILAKLNAEFTKGLTWWLQSHANYTGLAAHTASGAINTVRQWIKDLGVTPPPPANKVPSDTGSGQGGNTEIPAKKDETGKVVVTDDKIFGMDSTTFLLIAAAGVGVLMMNKKGR